MIRATLALVVAMAALDPQAKTAKPGEWIDLFDGKTTAGWHAYNGKGMPAGWQVVDGVLTRVEKAADIVSDREFDNFELVVEWKIPPKANSGLFYRVVEHPDDTSMWMAAPEYQLIDDRGYPGPLKPTQKTAGNYDLQPPSVDATKPAGEWNTTRIVVNGAHVEHWLNGKQIVAYELWTDEWNKQVAQSKFKDHPRYARAKRGRIGIQDHGDRIAFRSVRVRPL
jgi:hypothetical protein